MKNYMIELRNSLKDENKHMPLLQCGAAIVIINNKNEILLQSRADRDLWGLPGGCQELGETYDFESKDMKFFSIEKLPQNLMDKDLINKYIETIK